MHIYLDNNATTGLDPRVLQAMLVDLHGDPLNPSSVHAFGKKAKELLTKSRETLASFFSVSPQEILFTSGGTESINLFIRGLKAQGHVISSTIEHSAVYNTLKAEEKEGLAVTYLPVDLYGAPTPAQVAAAIRPNTRAILLSAVNSETGVKLDLEEIARIAHANDLLFFVDAVAHIGKETFSMHPGISAVALSGHKFHAPKGVGVLVLRSCVPLAPQITGGAQEFQKRAGTENLCGILGLAEAIRILASDQKAITNHLLHLRELLESALRKEIPNLIIHGTGPKIANVLAAGFPGIDGETLLIRLDQEGVAVSHGSACASGAIEPSRVLTSMGVLRKLARSSLRFSIGRFNTPQEILLAAQKTSHIVKKLSLA